MKILIATGIYPPDIGGPALYAKHLTREFIKSGHTVGVIKYTVEKKLPSGFRHLIYFLKLISRLGKTDLIIALDTFSVGLPSVLASRIFRKKMIMRLGGDFLWESYVERSGNLITLKQFYENTPDLSIKEKVIFYLSKFVLRNCSALVFSTGWQKEIFEKMYGFEPKKSYTIENFYGEKIATNTPKKKNFLWAGRMIKLKNINLLRLAYAGVSKENDTMTLDIITRISHEELLEKMRCCYAIILPSLSEVSPNFILDAIRLNKPFILTKETGLYERLKNIAIFVDSSDVEDIKNKILFLAKAENYTDYKNRIIAFDFTHTWGQIADEFLNIYKKVYP